MTSAFPFVPLAATKERALLSLLAKAADERVPCPTNYALGMEVAAESHIPDLLASLEKRGAIVVERTGNRRRVMIAASRRWTDWTAVNRAGANARKSEVRGDDGGRLTEAEILARRGPNREPCPRCQVRADAHAQHGCGRPLPAWGLSGIGSMGLAHG